MSSASLRAKLTSWCCMGNRTKRRFEGLYLIKQRRVSHRSKGAERRKDALKQRLILLQCTLFALERSLGRLLKLEYSAREALGASRSRRRILGCQWWPLVLKEGGVEQLLARSLSGRRWGRGGRQSRRHP